MVRSKSGACGVVSWWLLSKQVTMKFLVILSVSVALSHGLIRLPTEKELNSFIRSIPRFPTRQLPLLPPSPLPSLHAEFNRTFRGQYKPLEGCSLNKTLELWESGLIQTPNYPEDYPSDTSCEWIIEGPPGSVISANVFDLETQAWLVSKMYVKHPIRF